MNKELDLELGVLRSHEGVSGRLEKTRKSLSEVGRHLANKEMWDSLRIATAKTNPYSHR